MKIIVTGGAGFIGSHIVDALVEEGHEMHIIDDISAGKDENINPKAIMHKLDIRDGEALLPIFASSFAVYGNQDTLPIVESMIPSPLSPYVLHGSQV